MDEKLLGRLSFLSRLSRIDSNIANDFEQILNFVNKIVEFKVENQEHKNRKININSLREDKTNFFLENKNIINNFSNKEDDFCVVPITVEKGKIEDGEEFNG